MTPEGEYVKAGTLPFHLGEIYRSFSEDKERIASGSDSGYVIYKEGAFFILPIALLLALVAKTDMRISRSAIAGLAVWMAIALIPSAIWAQSEDSMEQRFSAAIDLLEQGDYAESEIAFRELVEILESSDTGPINIAASLFNQGLSRLKQAERLSESSPRDALDVARGAQGLFFDAARYRPGYRRAGARLDEVAVMLEALQARVRDEENREQERDEKIEALLQRIRELREAQIELRETVESSDVERRPVQANRFSRASTDEQPIPENADVKGEAFTARQLLLRQEGLSIQVEMRNLDTEFSMASALSHDNSSESVQTVMREPLLLMQKALEAQKEAEELLPQWRYWISARARQSETIDRLQEILDLFASNSEDEGEGDWNEEDWEEFMDTDPGEAVAASMPMKGEFRKDAMMQPLPIPNFSAEDILMEEKSSQQFRQQQRAKANAGKVEKDW
jgi:Ca-activated chloride channel family protein